MDHEMKNFERNGTEVYEAQMGASRRPSATENDGLFPKQNPDAESQRTLEKTSTRRKVPSKCKIVIVIGAILVFIAIVVGISLAVCSELHVDSDEDFDSSLFIVPLSFVGSFRLPNRVFTNGLFTNSSNESQALTADLQDKLVDLYTSSPALGRYFSQAEIKAFRNGSVIADYQLMFLMPEEEQDQLRNVTLSREMVYNVFRQFLYDLEADDSGPMYIDPVSLHMFLSV